MSSARGIVKTYRAIGPLTGVTPAAVSGSMAATITGPTTTIDRMDQVCYEVAWTSSNAVGVISIQGSVDNVTFYDLTFDPILAQPASNNGGYLVNLALIPFPYIRVKYTRTSGTGALVATLSAKGT